jgi:hypothetical protein
MTDLFIHKITKLIEHILMFYNDLGLGVMIVVFDANFNNISVISWRSVLLAAI